MATATAFLAWLSRSVENAPPLGAGTPKDSPRAAIGWWFVPIASLVKPYQIVADLYRRMAAPGSAQTASVTIVAVWWLCFIGQGFLARVAQVLPMTSLDTIRTGLSILLISSVIDLVAAGLAIVIVRRIQQGADVRAGKLGLGPRVVGPTWPMVAFANTTGVTDAGPTPSSTGTGSVIANGATVAFCPTCGTARLPGARYCASCGRDLDVTAV